MKVKRGHDPEARKSVILFASMLYRDPDDIVGYLNARTAGMDMPRFTVAEVVSATAKEENSDG